MSNALLITDNTPAAASTPLIRERRVPRPLRDGTAKAIEIDDVWAIQFGQGGGGLERQPHQLSLPPVTTITATAHSA